MSDVAISADLASLERELVEKVRAIKRNDPLAPVTVIVGSNLQHIYLRRVLAKELGAVVNVRFHTLLDLAGEIQTFSATHNESMLALPEGAEALILRSVLEDARRNDNDIVFRPEASGLPEAIAATMRDLREGAIGADDLRQSAAPGDKRWTLAGIYESFRDRLKGFIDRTLILERAAREQSEIISASLSGSPVLVYGIYDLNELQFRLLLGVASGSAQLTVLVPWASITSTSSSPRSSAASRSIASCSRRSGGTA